MRKISTTTHGLIDFLTVGSMFCVANVMPASRTLRNVINMLAAGKLAYSLMTRHEAGLIKLIPTRAHLAMDAVGGATLAAAPLLLDDDADDLTTGACVALGLGDILVAAMTQPCSSVERPELDEPSTRRHRARDDRSLQNPHVRAPDKGPEPVPTPNAGIYDHGAIPPAARRDTGAHASSVGGF